MLPNTKIHAVYFSSRKHFKYLLLSLKSLIGLHSPYLENIYIYIDIMDPLGADQQVFLETLSPHIHIRKTENIVGSGKAYIMSEILGFQEVSKEVQEYDYLMKIDSDIIFLHDQIFHNVILSKNILIGHKEAGRPSFQYIQGGCYFMLANSVPTLADLTEQIFDEVSSKIHPNKKQFSIYSYPEDAVIYSIFQKKTDKILFLSFMDLYQPVWHKKSKDSCLVHFMKTKKLMWLYFYMGEPVCNIVHTFFIPWNVYIRVRKILKRGLSIVFNKFLNSIS